MGLRQPPSVAAAAAALTPRSAAATDRLRSVLLRRLLRPGVALLLAAVGFLIGSNAWVIRRTHDSIFTDLGALPRNDVALVLGTSATVNGRSPNPFFEGRMNAAARLYKAGKVRHLLVSGDNGRRGYDEPTWMRDALVARGVPASAVTLDYAGFRTLDSMARARAVFGVRRCTIVTDDFHQPRAVFLARSMGIDAVGFPSERVPVRWSARSRAREYAARAATLLEVHVLHTRARFYGPPVKIAVVPSD